MLETTKGALNQVLLLPKRGGQHSSHAERDGGGITSFVVGLTQTLVLVIQKVGESYSQQWVHVLHRHCY